MRLSNKLHNTSQLQKAYEERRIFYCEYKAGKIQTVTGLKRIVAWLRTQFSSVENSEKRCSELFKKVLSAPNAEINQPVKNEVAIRALVVVDLTHKYLKDNPDFKSFLETNFPSYPKTMESYPAPPQKPPRLIRPKNPNAVFANYQRIYIASFKEQVSQLFGPLREIDEQQKQVIHEIANHPEWAEAFEKFLKTAAETREHNIEQLKGNKANFEDEKNIDLIEAKQSLVSLPSVAMNANSDFKLELQNLAASLLETARLTNEQVHNDSFYIDLFELNEVEDPEVERARINKQEAIEKYEKEKDAINTETHSPEQKTKKLESLEKKKGYMERDKNNILERSDWENVERGSQNQFLYGERVIGFMTNKDHKVEFSVPLDFRPLGDLTQEQSQKILLLIKAENKTIFRKTQKGEKILHKDLKEAFEPLGLTLEQEIKLLPILIDYSNAVNKNLHMSMLSLGHGEIF